MDISQFLQVWYSENRRLLPWRETRDAYRIWLSEIILQQTRVAQGLDYYHRFVQNYPTVQALAAATEDDVLKLWQGLGYYSRARNLHKTARAVGDRPFPSAYADLLRLPGIGPYTAAAIASFSADEAVAVVDGNVYRVLSRLFDLDLPIDSTSGQKYFQQLATELLDRRHPALHNQAIMEFGALQCTPTSPLCPTCPLADKCLALQRGTIAQRPVKAGKTKVRDRHLHYYLLKEGDRLWVHQRGAGDIWQGLWEFYVVEEGVEDDAATRLKLPADKAAFTLRHLLSHQRLTCDFHIVHIDQTLTSLPSDYILLSWEEWQKKAVAKPIFDANRRFSALFSAK